MNRPRILPAIILVLLSGCSAYKHVAPVSKVFLEDVDTAKKIKNLPFDHSWAWAKDLKPGQYTSVMIPAIRTDTLPKGAYLASISALITSEADYLAKADEVAKYFHEQMVEKMKSYPDARVKVVDSAGPGTAVMNIALTELEFSHPAANLATLASPIPGTGAALASITQPHAAFAMRISDSQTGSLLATAADRKFPPLRVADLNQYTVSSSVREICGFWAEEITETLQKGRFAEVDSVGRFRIIPW